MFSGQVVVLAVDGGGTTCRALLCNQTGEILGYAEAGSINYHSVGEEQTIKTLTKLLLALPCRPLSVECAVFGLAGLDTAKDRSVLTHVIKTCLTTAGIQAGHVLVENDGMITLAGAVGTQQGVLLIAGTGSIAWGAACDGSIVRVGGWGSRAGDEGSGFSIGMSAIRHVLRASDGRENQSAICAAILQEKGITDVENLIDWIYGSQYSPESVAALAPIVFKLALAGDEKSTAILNQAAVELSLMAITVINQLKLNNSALRVILAGGVLQNNAFLCTQIIDQINLAVPCAKVVSPLYQPITGGALVGLRICGFAADDILRRLDDGLLAAKKKQL